MTTRNEADRPVHRVVNLATGEVTDTPITDAEWDEIEAGVLASAAAEAARAAEDEELRQAVAAHPDPVVQALARRAGLL